MNGFTYLLKGFRLITQKGVRAYVIVPLIINILVFVLLLMWGSHQFGDLLNWIDSKLPSWLQWLNWLLWLLFVTAAMVLVTYTFTLIANLIGAPFNGFLSAKLQKLMTNKEPEDGLRILTVVPAALKRQLQYILYYLGWAVLTLILFFIPVVNLIATPIWFLFNAWMMSMQYLDFVMDNNGNNFKAMRAWMIKERWTTLSFGVAVMVATLIPIVNFLVMPAAVMGATLMYLDKR